MASINITAQGVLTLTVEADAVSVTSHFDDLHVDKYSKTMIKEGNIDRKPF